MKSGKTGLELWETINVRYIKTDWNLKIENCQKMKRTTYHILLVLALIFVVAKASTNAQKAELVVQTGHTGFVTSVAFSPDGKTLASGSGVLGPRFDTPIKLWDINTGKELKTLSGHTGWVSSVVFSPDGKTLASGSFDKTIKLWDVTSGQVLRTLSRHTFPVFSVVFSPDGKTLASGSLDSTIPQRLFILRNR